MPGPVSLIVNPAAGGGRSLRVLPQVIARLDALGVDHEVAMSASLGDAAERAAAAASAGRTVVAVGGDGLAGTLAGALAPAMAGGGATLGIIPAGRGNDLAGTLGIPRDPAAAVLLLAGGRPRQVDLIGVSVPGHPEQVVASSVYLGVPSVAGEIANAMRWLPGPAIYPVAALRALATWRPAGFRLECSGGTAAATSEFPGYAVVIANSACFGAGMKVAPPALLDDGVLDMVTMRHGPRLAFLRVLLTIRSGAHVALPLVALDRATAVTLTVDRPLPAAADGETLPWAGPLPAGTPLTIRAMPAALTVLVPPPDEGGGS